MSKRVARIFEFVSSELLRMVDAYVDLLLAESVVYSATDFDVIRDRLIEITASMERIHDMNMRASANGTVKGKSVQPCPCAFGLFKIKY